MEKPDEKEKLETEVLEDKTKTATTETAEKKDWDKEKQKEDQQSATYRKLSKQIEEMQGQYDTAFSQLSEQLATIGGKLVEKDNKTDELPELDPTLVDGNVIKYIKLLKGKTDEAEKTLAITQRKIAEYEQQEGDKAAKARKDSTVEKILKPLDEEFGAKFRKRAIDLADKMINDGDEDQPTDALEASQLMRKCYKKLSEDKPAEKKTIVDDGKGTIASEKTVPKEGNLEDVWQQMKAEGKFKP